MKRFVLLFLITASLAFGAAPLLAAQPATPAAGETAAVAAPLNINTASTSEIEKLPGIGKKSAAAIVAYRTDKGKFKTPKDLLKVKGVGAKTLDKIKNLISFE